VDTVFIATVARDHELDRFPLRIERKSFKLHYGTADLNIQKSRIIGICQGRFNTLLARYRSASLPFKQIVERTGVQGRYLFLAK